MLLRVLLVLCICCFKQKTAYEMRISDWSSDVCSSDLSRNFKPDERQSRFIPFIMGGLGTRTNREMRSMLIKNKQDFWSGIMFTAVGAAFALGARGYAMGTSARMGPGYFPFWLGIALTVDRKSTRLELQSLMRISYAVFCLKKKKRHKI